MNTQLLGFLVSFMNQLSNTIQIVNQDVSPTEMD